MDRVELYLIFAGLGALIGALITPLVYWAKGRKPTSGFFAGIVVGAFGNLICLIPFWLLIKPRLEGPTSGYFDMAVAYNLGVAAVLGNRREEARYYFVQVTQADPRNVGAWLYLANLATTPLEAWSFVQQARAIDPGNPGVLEATMIVWPQVRHLYGKPAAPNAPPPPAPIADASSMVITDVIKPVPARYVDFKDETDRDTDHVALDAAEVEESTDAL